MIVNIKPNHLRKSSRGLEFAVALGILLKTDQIDAAAIDDSWVLYGELGLDGQVYEPSDLKQNETHLKNIKILTGRGQDSSCYRLENLSNIEINFTQNQEVFKRPRAGLNRVYTKEEAEFLFLAATSGLHSLLAGDAGAGKSTLAYSLISFLREPHSETNIRIEKSWRPLVAPHHSISKGAFLGGGHNLFEGELERVQGGLLLLDEFSQFSPEILEALRAPMTGDNLRLSRGAYHREYTADFQVVATTNLCPCGKWTPLKRNLSCRYSRSKCTGYLEKFSGPLLDRFGLMFFTHCKQERTVAGEVILKRVQKCLEVKSRPAPVRVPRIIETYHSNLSTRRKNYLNQVAQVYALERIAQGSSGENVAELCIEDYNKAERWVIKPFEQLEKGMG